jgi:hypothetical protein
LAQNSTTLGKSHAGFLYVQNTTNIRIVTHIVSQDEISMGFDRLVAMASEVDKRSKSAENSPAHNSPRKGEGDSLIIE